MNERREEKKEGATTAMTDGHDWFNGMEGGKKVSGGRATSRQREWEWEWEWEWEAASVAPLALALMLHPSCPIHL